MGERIRIFDALKVLAIVMVVITHLPLQRVYPFNFFITIPHVCNYSIGQTGVVIFVLVSGCLLELAYGNREYSLSDFYEKRITRLYPAFWISLLFAVAVAPAMLFHYPVWVYAAEMLSISFWFNMGMPPLNGPGWFIGMLFGLYLLYPFLSQFIRKYPGFAILSILIFNLEFNFLSFVGEIDIVRAWYRLPFGHLFIFSLGILIASRGLYPRATSSPALAYAADMSFYVFLAHGPMVFIWNSSPVAFVFATIGAAVILQQMDRALQTRVFPAINAWGEQRRLAREARPPGIRT